MRNRRWRTPFAGDGRLEPAADVAWGRWRARIGLGLRRARLRCNSGLILRRNQPHKRCQENRENRLAVHDILHSMKSESTSCRMSRKNENRLEIPLEKVGSLSLR